MKAFNAGSDVLSRLTMEFFEDTTIVCRAEWGEEGSLLRARQMYAEGRISLSEFERWVDTILRHFQRPAA